MEQAILNYINQQTENIDWNDLDFLTLNAISLEVNRNKKEVQKTLFELNKNGKIIRINTHPIIYVSRLMLEKKYNTSISENVYETLDELLKDIRFSKIDSSFHELIGYNGSLKSCINQCVAAIQYPGNGLPILLMGSSGTGKSYIARLIYEHGHSIGRIKGDFIPVNCSEYSNNPELFLTNVFGYKKGSYTGAEKDNQGILHYANNGILFLDEVHGLPPECQEKIFQFMDSGSYHMVGDNVQWYKSNVQIIMATTENPNQVLLKTLLRRIPLIVQIPDLNDRPLQERRELIHYLFTKEEKHVGKEIQLSRMVYHVLQATSFTGNIGEVKNIIKTAVANGLLKSQKDEIIHIHINNLPPKFYKKGANILDDKVMLSVKQLLNKREENHNFYQFHYDIINHLKNNKHSFLNETEKQYIYGKTKIYIDLLFYDLKQDEIYQNNINLDFITQVLKIIENKYHSKHFTNSEIEIIYKLVAFSADILTLNKKALDDESVRTCYKKVLDYFLVDEKIIEDFYELIKDTVLIENVDIFKLDLLLLFVYFLKDFNDLTTASVIIAHGYSIASEMANNVNHLLERHVFDSIDMPLDCDFKDVVDKLIIYLDGLSKKRNDVIVLVDMGSLENIYRYLSSYPFNIGIIDNVTTKLCLEVGTKLIQNESIINVLEQASSQNVSHYTLIEKEKKQEIILTICETGLGMANAIADLVKQSLPKKIDILIIPYDYQSLVAKGKKLPLFHTYHVCFILGTTDPNLEGIPFLSIFEIMDQRNANYIQGLMKNYFSDSEVSQFCNELLKNFTIENLKNYLNVISPQKIIDDIQAFVNDVQKELDIQLNSNLTCCLYIHLACMVERILLHEEINRFEALDTIINHNQDFFKKIKKSFKRIEKTYNIQIPDQEIAYLHEYIYSRYEGSKEITDEILSDLFIK